MKILFSKHYLGSKIVEAFSYIPEYTTKIITKTEVFEENFGIIPLKVKIEMTSQLLQTKEGIDYKIILTIGNIVLTDKYCIIYMKIQHCFFNGVLIKVHLISDEPGLAKKIGTVVYQAIKNLDRKVESEMDILRV
jgi:hypothetical protein